MRLTNGLVVPVIPDADRKNVWMVADEIRDLAAHGPRRQAERRTRCAAARSRITNIGSAGGMFFTPVINFPEVAILGTGRIAEKPVVQERRDRRRAGHGAVAKL